MSKHFLATILIVGSLLFVMPSQVKAQDYNQQLKTFAQASGAGEQEPADPRVVIAQVIKFMFGIVGIMFFAYSVYAGYLILSSAGDEQKIKKGKDTLRTGIIGIFVAMSAYSILSLVSETALRSSQEGPAAYQDFDPGNQDYQN